MVSDRNRGGAFLAVGVAGVAMFATFLFLTYYLQQSLGFSPIECGLAFLPMVVAIFAWSPRRVSDAAAAPRRPAAPRARRAWRSRRSASST